MAPRKKNAPPKKLPEGFIVTDGEKKKWRLGGVIGEGGFGLIYLASQDVNQPVAEDSDFVIKVEYHENGPLFSELKFYQRAAKPESVERWKRGRKLDFLGIPRYWGSGLAEHGDLRYRFMVMDRLGSDLQKLCRASGGRMKKDTALRIGQRAVDVLEYIHDNEYVHADIKAANFMLGHRDPQQVYLADYGLSYRYCPDGVHKDYKENPKKGHNGTIEYTSLDAHKGAAPSRRGDLQILGFCLLHWIHGSLPWDGLLKNPLQVQEAKARLMGNLPGSVQQLSGSGASTDEVSSLLQYLTTLDYKDRPDYQRVRELLGGSARGPLDFSGPDGPGGSACTDPRAPEPRARGKKPAGPARAPPKTPSRTPARAGPAPADVDQEEPDQVKPKPVPARYRRGPPPSKPPAQQKEDVSAGRPGLRPRTARRYHDDSSEQEETEDEDEEDEEEEDEEEEDDRPKPIPKRYLRGPPIGPPRGPGAPSKQSNRSRGDTEDVMSARRDPRLHPQLRPQLRPRTSKPATRRSCKEGWEEDGRPGAGPGDDRGPPAAATHSGWTSCLVCLICPCVFIIIICAAVWLQFTTVHPNPFR
ncbi:serine/threonine-protein kinase VRK2 isoform X1 [Cololabis saira]|uniref:serine/threonine-protein kinase VRK2 isoform X1 n=1 Tax=Cololabis saira TaxID=129043 RepID=UPI002AD33FBB|nr:serine/threonine-protein kinase VRK2 isoform X1 [Cololabis saira]